VQRREAGWAPSLISALLPLTFFSVNPRLHARAHPCYPAVGNAGLLSRNGGGQLESFVMRRGERHPAEE
jgi:hypothetical protein